MIRVSKSQQLLKIFAFSLVFIAGSWSVDARSLVGPANSPWPMYQHDPRHSGQSQYTGITQQPVLLWIKHLAVCYGEEGGMSVDEEGIVYASSGGCLSAFNKVTLKTNWRYWQGDNSRAVPYISDNGLLYWGYGDSFAAIRKDGQTEWFVNGLNGNYVFGSSPVMDNEGNLYFSHDGMWSFTSSGEYRWSYLYPFFSHSSPAIGPDGTIYGTSDTDLFAFKPDGTVKWHVTRTKVTEDSTPAVGPDGIIYVPYNNARLFAYDPDGNVKWIYVTEEAKITFYSSISPSVVVGSDGTIYFGTRVHINLPEPSQHIYALNPDGTTKWKFPVDQWVNFIVLDRNNNLYICLWLHSCFGLDSNGNKLWKYNFPPVGGKPIGISTAPVIGQDGLIYMLDGYNNVYALGDPDLYPSLIADKKEFIYDVELGAPDITESVHITSNKDPLPWAAKIRSGTWVTVSPANGTTPSELTLDIHASELPNGNHTTALVIQPVGMIAGWIEIPITLKIHLPPPPPPPPEPKRIFIPITENPEP